MIQSFEEACYSHNSHQRHSHITPPMAVQSSANISTKDFFSGFIVGLFCIFFFIGLWCRALYIISHTDPHGIASPI